MVFKRFTVGVAQRVILLTLSLLLLASTVSQGIYPALSLLLIFIAMLQIVEMIKFVSRTNFELSRFLEAARYGDYGPRFEGKGKGSKFDELGNVFADIMSSFKASRQKQEEAHRYLKALTNHVPVPLISIKPDDSIVFHNHAARHLFKAAKVTQLSDLAQFGEALPIQLQGIAPGKRLLVDFSIGNTEKQLAVIATKIVVGGQKEYLISLQDIGAELDSAQLDAWESLVKVLTHEIMNSITPVSSLSKTATDLVDDTKLRVDALPKDMDIKWVTEDLSEIKKALEIVARRSDGLMQFVENYQRLTRLPKPQMETLAVKEILQQVATLVSPDLKKQSITLNIDVNPEEITVFADREMLEQVLINLLKNSQQALMEQAFMDGTGGVITLEARANSQRSVTLAVEDNGLGFPADIAAKAFMPFFTTKPDGSGIGLALTRQVMIAHNGNVSITQAESGGARVALVFARA